MPRLKAIKTGFSMAKGPYVEAEINVDSVKLQKKSSSEFMILYLYTINDIILKKNYFYFIRKIKEKTKDNNCQINPSGKNEISINCNGIVINVLGRTLVDEMGLDTVLRQALDDSSDVDLDFIEGILEELGISDSIEDIEETYLYVEISIALPLSKLDWLRKNISWILDAMVALDAKYNAKIIVNAQPRKPELLRRLPETIKQHIISNKTILYIKGVHYLQDPELYKILKKAFTSKWWF
ncbi:MAG: hypothetical protein LRS48_00650 [Desulfurococcales archaeon]|nr:hypothetical protein [Desulfurococcales archaeon]